MDKLRYREIGDYYVCDIMLIAYILISSKNMNVPDDVKEEATDIFYKYHSFSAANMIFGYQKEIAILKESKIGDFMAWNPKNFLNEKFEITYKKIVGAYNMAVITNNEKMTNKIYPFFIDYNGEHINKLSDHNYDNLRDYILDNNDFFGYIAKQNKTPIDKEYLVYENNGFQIKRISKEVQKVKK